MKHTYLFAGIPIEVTHEYDYITKTSTDYLSQELPQYRFHITQNDIDSERKRSEDERFPAAYWESLVLLRKFCDATAKDGVLLFHSVAIAVDGKAYLFTALSGTGKSTHALLWQSLLGDRMTMINGDKPFIKRVDGVFHAFGSPWNGKEEWGTNTSAPIAGICFLHRSPTNEIKRMTQSEAFRDAYRQIHKPGEVVGAKSALLTLTDLLGSCPLYSLGCNMLPEAGKLSFQTMTGGTL